MTEEDYMAVHDLASVRAANAALRFLNDQGPAVDQAKTLLFSLEQVLSDRVTDLVEDP